MKDKINSIFDDETLDTEAKRTALLDITKDFVPKARLTEYADRVKNLETEKKEINNELTQIKEANLTAEEKMKLDKEKLEKDQKELSKKLNEVDARQVFANAGLPKEKIDELVGKVVSEDKERTLSLANSFVEVLSEVKETTKKTTTTELLNATPTPKIGNSSEKTITKEDFAKMEYSEKKQLYTENQELFKQLSE